MEEYEKCISNAKLTDIEKEVCNYIFVHGYTYNQIADKIGYSESGVKKIASRIIKKI